MFEYELIFILDGIDPNDHHAGTDLHAQFNAELGKRFGVYTLTVPAKGKDACAAAVSLVCDVRGAVGTIRFVQLDRDLVNAADIAKRTGSPIEDVDSWARGDLRGAAAFPSPEASVGDSPVWLWCEVNEWLTHLDLGDGKRRPNRYEMNEIDTLLPYIPATGVDALHHRPRVSLVSLLVGSDTTND